VVRDAVAQLADVEKVATFAVVAFVDQLAVIGSVDPVPIVACFAPRAVTMEALSQNDAVMACDAEMVVKDEDAHDALTAAVAIVADAAAFAEVATNAYDEERAYEAEVAVDEFVDQLAVIGKVDPVPIVGCLVLSAVTIEELFQNDAVSELRELLAHDALTELVA
jgi:hypothetical protein